MSQEQSPTAGDLSRRAFLQRSGLAAGALALHGSLPTAVGRPGEASYTLVSAASMSRAFDRPS